MFHPADIQPDVELREYLQGRVVVGEDEAPVAVYGDWERPTNDVPDDFIVIMMNGNPSSVGLNVDYAKGWVMVSLYCRLNNDGSVKKNRVKRILRQFDNLVEGHCTTNYHFKHEAEQFITPTTPNSTSGYSVTTLNLKWTTTNKFNKPVTP